MKKSKKLKQSIRDLTSLTTSQLESEGIYTPLFDFQIEVVGIILTKVYSLMEVMEGEDYKPVISETSREGAPRLKCNPCEEILQDYLSILLRALRGLGMNTDSKEPKKAEEDKLKQLLDEMKDG